MKAAPAFTIAVATGVLGASVALAQTTPPRSGTEGASGPMQGMMQGPMNEQMHEQMHQQMHEQMMGQMQGHMPGAMGGTMGGPMAQGIPQAPAYSPGMAAPGPSGFETGYGTGYGAGYNAGFQAALNAIASGRAFPPAVQQQQQMGQAAPTGGALDLSASGVRMVEHALNQLGYDVGRVNGVWSPQTTAALRNFQRDRGMEPTGRLNVGTVAAMGLEAGPLIGTARTGQTGQQGRGQTGGFAGGTGAEPEPSDQGVDRNAGTPPGQDESR